MCIVFEVADALYFFPIKELISAMNPYCCSVNSPLCQSKNIRFSGFEFTGEKNKKKNELIKYSDWLKEVTLLFSDHKRQMDIEEVSIRCYFWLFFFFVCGLKWKTF